MEYTEVILRYYWGILAECTEVLLGYTGRVYWQSILGYTGGVYWGILAEYTGMTGIYITSFPGPAQLSVTSSMVKQERAWYLFSRE